MARVDAYGEIGNDLGQTQSVGGARGNASRVWAWLNTDNGSKSDCALRVSAEVVGERQAGGKPRKTCHSCGRRWKQGSFDGQRYVEAEEGVQECPDCGAPRQGRDTRKTVFHIGLPEQTDANCEVRIEVGNPALNRLAHIGVFLCAVKGVSHIANGQTKRGRATLETAGQILQELEAEAQNHLPNVTLPNGVTLAHALACVQIVQDIIGGPSKGN